MRILVADRLAERFVEAMGRGGHECVVDAGLTETSLPGSMGGVDILVLNHGGPPQCTASDTAALRLDGARHLHPRQTQQIACSVRMS